MRKRPRNSGSSYPKVGIRSLLSSLPPAPRNAPKIQPPALTNRANQTEPPAVRVPSSAGPPPPLLGSSPLLRRPYRRSLGLDGCGGHVFVFVFVVTHGEERGRGLGPGRKTSHLTPPRRLLRRPFFKLSPPSPTSSPPAPRGGRSGTTRPLSPPLRRLLSGLSVRRSRVLRPFFFE